MTYDFLIKDKDKPLFLIECQGEQHYRLVKFFGGIERFQQQIKYDDMKALYAAKIDIPLIIIPYWMSDYKDITDIISKELSKFIDEEK